MSFVVIFELKTLGFFDGTAWFFVQSRLKPFLPVLLELDSSPNEPEKWVGNSSPEEVMSGNEWTKNEVWADKRPNKLPI